MKKYLPFLLSFFFAFNNYAQIVPTITTPPMSMIKCAGNSATLTVEANGSQPLSYQWKKNGTIISGETSNLLNFISLQLTDEAGYVCVVTNAYGNATTDTAFVRVAADVPVITTHPSGIFICEGDSAYFSIGATGDYLGFQWLKNGSNITNGFGSFYVLYNATTSNSGQYSCQVSNACGSVTSTTANLTVNLPPAITVQPTNQVVCLGSNAQFTITTSGTNVNYQWKKDGSNISGANLAYLSIPGVTVNDEAAYSCVVWNNCDTVTSSAAVLTTNSLPSITAQPYDFNECEGDTVKFITTANGTPPITYQWYHGLTSIVDSTNNTLTLNNFAASDGGEYFCLVTNTCVTVSTDTAQFDVKTAPTFYTQPMDAIRCTGDTVSFSVKVDGTEPFVYQWRKEGANISGADATNYSISILNVGHAGNYTCLVTNECGFAISDTANLIVQTPPLIVLEPINLTECEGQVIVLTMQVQGSEPLSYYWTHNDNVLPGSGHNHYTLYNITSATEGNYICYVSNDCGADTSNPVVISVNTLPHVTLQPVDQQTCVGGNASFSMSAESNLPLSYTWTFNGSDLSSETSTTLSLTNVNALNAGQYACRIWNTCGDTITESATLSVNEEPEMNSILVNKTRCAGDTITLTANATGGTISYSWLHDGNAISGATDSVLHFPSLSVSDDGTYYCLATNNCGSDATNTMTLTVNPAPEVDLGSDVTLCAGDSTILNGGDFMTYTWNNGMHTPSLTVDTPGVFILEAYNTYSCYGSDTVYVFINPVLEINLIEDTAVCGSIILDAGVVASSYSWNNGQGTSQTFTVTQTGLYTLVVSAAGGCTSKDSVAVVVNPIPTVSLGPDTSMTTRDTLVIEVPDDYYSYLWSNGATENFITLDGSTIQPGFYSYNIEVRNEEGCMASDAMNVDVILSSIRDIISSNMLSVYPNPANDLTFIEISNEQHLVFSIEIIDITGKIIVSKTCTKDSEQTVLPICLSAFNSGIYFVQIKTGNGIISKKLVVE